MDTETIIIVSAFSGVAVLLLVMVVVLFAQLASLKKKVNEMQATGRLRIQKLKMNPDKNHAFHNPALSPDEELSRRGYSMYMGSEPDIESARPSERLDTDFQQGLRFHSLIRIARHEPPLQLRETGGEFVEELTRELDSRQHRQSTAPPFLLQSIEENKKKTREMFNPHSNGRPSDTNPNFIY